MVQLRSGKLSTLEGPVERPVSAPPPSAAVRTKAAVPWVGVTYMVLLTLQYGLQPMLTSRYTPPTVNKTLVVLAQEAAKAACALTVMGASCPGALAAFFQPRRLASNLAAAAPPAAIYSVQNWATQLAYQALDSVTFNCLNQTKLVSTALCVYLLFGTKQSYAQVFALALLLGSALVLQADSAPVASAVVVDAAEYRAGLVAILVASVLSGLASALCQNSLQRPQPMSSFELTLSMAIVSITLMVGSLAVSSDGAALRAGGAGTHLTAASLLPIGTNALGGILVGQVTKHMGGVSKGFSIVGGLVVCGVVQSIVNHTMLPAGVLVALLMVIVATSLHTCYPPAKRKVV